MINDPYTHRSKSISVIVNFDGNTKWDKSIKNDWTKEEYNIITLKIIVI